MDDPLDAAGVYPATYTKNTDQEWELRLWWCHFLNSLF
jgi:hypothetical protein